MKIQSRLFSIFLVTSSFLILLNLIVVYKSFDIECYLKELDDTREELYSLVHLQDFLHKYVSKSLAYILTGSESDLYEYFQDRGEIENIIKNRDRMKKGQTGELFAGVGERFFFLTNKIQNGIEIAESEGRQKGLTYFKNEVVPEFEIRQFESVNRAVASRFLEIEYTFDNLFASAGVIGWNEDQWSDPIRKTRESFKKFSKVVAVSHQINGYIQRNFLDFFGSDNMTFENLNEITYGLKRSLTDWKDSESYYRSPLTPGSRPKDYNNEIENVIKEIEEKIFIAFNEIRSGDKNNGEKILQKSIDRKIDFILYPIIDRAIEQAKDNILEEQNILRKRMLNFRIYIVCTSLSISFLILFVLFVATRGIKKSLIRITKESDSIIKKNPKYQKESFKQDELLEVESLLKQLSSYCVKADEDKRYFENLIMSMYPSMVIFSKECRIIKVNNALCHLLEYKEEEIAGSHIDILFPEKYLKKDVTTLNDFFVKGETINDERECLTKNGKLVSILFSASIIRNSSGEIINGLFIAQPFKKEVVKREMLAGSRDINLFCPLESFPFVYPLMISLVHELKSYFMDTLGYANFLMNSDEIALGQGARDTLNLISNENQKGIHILEELSRLSHIYMPVKEMIHVNSLLTEVIEEEHLEDVLKSVNIITDFDNSDPFFAGDKKLLSLVFINILKKIKGKIVKFNRKDGGSITIRTAIKGESLKIIFTFDVEADETELVKEGANLGLVTLKEGKIDESGIGLFICQGIIKEYGGKFIYENVLSNTKIDSAKKESRFIIELPLYARPYIDEYAEDDPQAAAYSLKGIKVLVADDEKVIRNWLKKLISACGGEAVTAENGLTAMNLLKEDSFDIIISDVKMPEMDGYELGSWLKMNKPDLMNRFILITGLIDKSLDDFSLEWRCNYLIKPFRGEELVLLILKILQKKG